MSDKLYELMDWPEIEAVVYSEEYAPREILGPHVTGDGVLVQCFFPGADKVTVKTTKDGKEYLMSKEDDAGYFAVLLNGRKIPEYTYLVEKEGEQTECYDAYAFPCQITLEEEQKFINGICYDIYEKLGAHPMTVQRCGRRVYFAVWAPNAMRVSAWWATLTTGTGSTCTRCSGLSGFRDSMSCLFRGLAGRVRCTNTN